MEESRSFVCIICPRGCRLEARRLGTGSIEVRGQACPRGEDYGRDELLDPRRLLTSTVRTVFPDRPRLPVKSSAPLPKARLMEAARGLDAVLVSERLRCGELVLSNLLGLGVDIVATDDLD